MDLKKIFGWIVLSIGLLIIFWILFSSYNIFTGKTKTPEVFKYEIKIETNEKEEISLKPEEIKKEVEEMIQNQLAQIVPTDFIVKILNLISWSILAAIFIFGASKISEIGIKLLKD